MNKQNKDLENKEEIIVEPSKELTEEEIFLLELGELLPHSIKELNIMFQNNNIKLDYVGKFAGEGLILKRWNDTIFQEAYEELAFTMLGEKKLFKVKYAEEIRIFKEYLKNEGYECDSQLIEDYLLIASNLTSDSDKILNVETLESFCITHDRYLKQKR